MKDPYLKPVIFGGLFITLLSIIFAPAIFLWAIIGGYITIRLASKITKEAISIIDGLFLGLFSGLIGGASLDVLTIISFNSPDNKRALIRVLEKNLPKDMQLQNLSDILPSIFLTTCIFIVIISVAFAILGSYIGFLLSKNAKKTEN